MCRAHVRIAFAHYAMRLDLVLGRVQVGLYGQLLAAGTLRRSYISNYFIFIG